MVVNKQSDRNLLYGLLAVRMELISRDALIAAISAWAREKTKPVSRILVEQGALSSTCEGLLDQLVEEHLKVHDNDATKSLVSLHPSATLRDDLQHISDPQWQATLDSVLAGPEADQEDPLRTETYDSQAGRPAVVGASSSTGQRFHVIRPFAQGGLGRVLVAHDEELHREVALKEILPQRAKTQLSRDRFVAEAEITGGLEHPGIVPVYGLGKYQDGRPFYAMRFIRGLSLKDAIDRYHGAGGPERDPGARSLEFRQLLRRFIDVCNVIGYAHNRRVLHRDLKPSNVMLGSYGETIVVDWGLAKVMDRPEVEVAANGTVAPLSLSSTSDVVATQVGSRIGTPAYMSPEQAAGELERMGTLTDIYGLGATLYHILTGDAPVSGSDPVTVIGKAMRGEFRAPRELAPRVPKALEAVCLKAMARDPDDRYPSAAAIANDVEHWLADEPVSVVRDSPGARVGRWTRRNRAWTQACAVALLLVAVTSATAAILVNRARREAVQQKEYAVARLRDARAAIDKWVTGGGEAMKDIPELQNVRKQLLQMAAQDYERLARQGVDDVDLETERGRALLRLGDIRRMLGESVAAKRAYLDARDIFDNYPTSSDCQLELANSHTRLGLLLADSGATTDAEVEYRAAVQILRELNGTVSGQPQVSTALGSTLLNHGVLLIQPNELERAEEYLRQAVGVFEQLAKQHTDQPRYGLSLAKARLVLGRILITDGRYEQALDELDRSFSTSQELTKQDPKSHEYRASLAAASDQRAKLLGRLGRVREQLAAYRLAEGIYQDLTAILPHVRSYREYLATIQYEYGRLLHRLGRVDEAETELRDAVVLSDELLIEFAAPRYAEWKVACADAIGQVLRDLNEDAVALEVYEKAMPILAGLVEGHAEVTVYRERLAVCQSHLGQLLHKMGDEARALKEFTAAVGTLENLIKDHPDIPRISDELAFVYNHLGHLHLTRNDAEQAQTAFQRARDLWQHLAKAGDSPAPEYLHNLVWFLASGAGPADRDPQEAVRYAKQLEKAAAHNPAYCLALGVAYYRTDNWQESIKWLNDSMRLRHEDDDARDQFFLAMALWEQGEGTREEARKHYQEAVDWMQDTRPGNLQLRRIHQEATQLMGVHPPP